MCPGGLIRTQTPIDEYSTYKSSIFYIQFKRKGGGRDKARGKAKIVFFFYLTPRWSTKSYLNSMLLEGRSDDQIEFRFYIAIRVYRSVCRL